MPLPYACVSEIFRMQLNDSRTKTQEWCVHSAYILHTENDSGITRLFAHPVTGSSRRAQSLSWTGVNRNRQPHAGKIMTS